jgi:hypothetical protein
VVVPSIIVPNTRKRPECELLDDFDDADELNYQNFKVVTKYKTVRYDGLKFSTEVSSAELRQGKKRIATLSNRVSHPMGNSTEFGMFNLLGKDKSQLVVQQTAWRSGNHWIFDLSDGNARKIYSSWDWGAAREDICVVDLDGDGTLEISQLVTSFYDLMDKFAVSSIPLPSIVFKYDQHSRKYAPANHQFREYVLDGVTDVDATVSPNDRHDQALIIGTLLDYVFAGQRETGCGGRRPLRKPTCAASSASISAPPPPRPW